jgi:hypothetical protein
VNKTLPANKKCEQSDPSDFFQHEGFGYLCYRNRNRNKELNMLSNIHEMEQLEWGVDTSIDQIYQLINALDNGNSDVKCLSELESLIRKLASTDCQISQEKAKSSLYHFFPEYINVVARLPPE